MRNDFVNNEINNFSFFLYCNSFKNYEPKKKSLFHFVDEFFDSKRENLFLGFSSSKKNIKKNR